MHVILFPASCPHRAGAQPAPWHWFVLSRDRHGAVRKVLLVPRACAVTPDVPCAPSSFPQQQPEWSARSSAGFANRADAVQRSAASRGSEGTSRDLAAVAYTVQNNFLLLWLFLMCFIQFQPNQVKCFSTLSFFRLFTEGKCNLP